uniref:Uncharacterized protein n=1 Tax=Zooxanthella nutricula TaxID=1333877 RepID=A0A7S2QAI8_9DINO
MTNAFRLWLNAKGGITKILVTMSANPAAARYSFGVNPPLEMCPTKAESSEAMPILQKKLINMGHAMLNMSCRSSVKKLSTSGGIRGDALSSFPIVPRLPLTLALYEKP